MTRHDFIMPDTKHCYVVGEDGIERNDASMTVSGISKDEAQV